MSHHPDTGSFQLAKHLFSAPDAVILAIGDWSFYPWNKDLEGTHLDGFTCTPLSSLPSLLFFTPTPELIFGGHNNASPNICYYRQEEALPRYSKDKDFGPDHVLRPLSREQFDRYFELGVIVGSRSLNTGRRRIDSIEGEAFFLKDPPKEDYQELEIRRVGKYGLHPCTSVTGDSFGIEMPFGSEESLPGIDILKIWAVSDTTIYPEDFRVTDPILASTILPWLGNVPKDLRIVFNRDTPWPDSYVAFDHLVPELFTNGTAEFYRGYITFPRKSLAGINLGSKVVEASRARKPTLLFTDYDSVYPLSKLTKVPKLKRDLITKFRAYRLSPSGNYASTGFYTLPHIAEALIKSIPSVSTNLKSRYPWYRTTHVGFSEGDLHLHDLYLKSKGAPEWDVLPISESELPVSTSGDAPAAKLARIRKDFFLKYFSQDTNFAITSPIANVTLYRRLTYEAIKANSEAFNAFLDNYLQRTPFLFQLLDDPEVVPTIITNMLSS